MAKAKKSAIILMFITLISKITGFIRDIIFNSCEFYGSTYNGRLDFSKSVLNLNIKLPIIIDIIQNILNGIVTNPDI